VRVHVYYFSVIKEFQCETHLLYFSSTLARIFLYP